MSSETTEHTARNFIKRLWVRYISKQKRTLLLAFFFMTILAIAQSVYVFFIRYLVDFAQQLSSSQSGTSSAITENLAQSAISGKLPSPKDLAFDFTKVVVPAILALTLVSGGSMFAQRILTSKIALTTIAGLQRDMLKSAHKADYAFFTRNDTGDILSRFTNDMVAVTSSLIRSMTNLFKDILTIIGLLATMLYMDPILSGISVSYTHLTLPTILLV